MLIKADVPTCMQHRTLISQKQHTPITNYIQEILCDVRKAPNIYFHNQFMDKKNSQRNT